MGWPMASGAGGLASAIVTVPDPEGSVAVASTALVVESTNCTVPPGITVTVGTGVGVGLTEAVKVGTRPACVNVYVAVSTIAVGARPTVCVMGADRTEYQLKSPIS